MDVSNNSSTVSCHSIEGGYSKRKMTVLSDLQLLRKKESEDLRVSMELSQRGLGYSYGVWGSRYMSCGAETTLKDPILGLEISWRSRDKVGNQE